MQAQILRIEERKRKNVRIPLSLADFTTSEGNEIDVEFVINDPSVSLCCLDDENHRAIFAELPPGIDPAQSPFFYQTQFENALRLFAVQYDDFFEAAKDVESACERFVFIHNIGRCGSTLLHNIFNKVDETVSLSEPDVLGQIRYLRTMDGRQDVHCRALMQACVPLLFNKSIYPKAEVGIIKLRNQNIDDIDLFWHAFPDAKHLFLYRSAEGWVSSIYRRRLRVKAPLEIDSAQALATLEAYHNRPIDLMAYGLGALPERISLVEELTIWWLMMMDRYLRFYSRGIRMPALRYEELNAKRTETLETLFHHMNLPLSAIADALEAFREDSQAGTRLARAAPSQSKSISFSESQLEAMDSILQNHDDIDSRAYVVPETMML